MQNLFSVQHRIYFFTGGLAATLLAVFLFAVPQVFAESVNLIPNSSFESSSSGTTPNSWAKGGYGSNVSVFSYPVLGHDSASAAKVEISSYTSGDRKWYLANDVPVTAGQQLTLNDWYQSNVLTDVTLRYHHIDGSYSYPWLADVPASTAWQRWSKDITIPAGVDGFNVFHNVQSVGWIVIDDVSLVDKNAGPVLTTTSTSVTATPNPADEGAVVTLAATVSASGSIATSATGTITFLDGASTLGSSALSNGTASLQVSTLSVGYHNISARYGGDGNFSASTSSSVTEVIQQVETQPSPSDNLILNPSFENSTNGTTPDSWAKGGYGTNTATLSYATGGEDGTHAARIDVSAYTSGDRKWYFLDVPVTPGVQYMFSDWSESNVPTNITLRYTKTDGSYTYPWLADVPASTSWQKTEVLFIVPDGVKSVTIFHAIESVGWLVVDNYSLTQASSSTQFAQGFVSINFDDGWLDAYDNALPILDAAGVKATMYIITNVLSNTWANFMHAPEIQSAKNRGYEIGAHTRTHPHLPTLNSSDLISEIDGSRQDLYNPGFGLTSTIAYPYGEYNAMVQQQIASAGFASARTTDHGLNFKDTPQFALKAYSVVTSDTFEDLQAQIDEAVQSRGWLILTFHHVHNDPVDEYTATTTLVQQVIDYLVVNYIPVRTNSEGVALMN